MKISEISKQGLRAGGLTNADIKKIEDKKMTSPTPKIDAAVVKHKFKRFRRYLE